MPDLEPYEIHAIRYGHNAHATRRENFLGGDPHDGPMPLDYFVWAIRGNGRTIVVDTGFDTAMGEKRGRAFLRSPGEGLRCIGIDPDRVEDVVVSHMHYDHCGNHGLFPRARYHLQDGEMAYATGRCMCHPALRAPFEAEDVLAMVRKVFEGRVTFHDGDRDLAPGISLHRVGGHSKGLQVVRVWTRRGWTVIASDASHFYANMEEGRPFHLLHSLEDTLEGYRKLYGLASERSAVIPGHDPLVLQRYPASAPGLDGIAHRLDADPTG
ncbi:N-acyl homoserine lactonase family protein [Enterovirga sp.]|jgi:glyoxylase-like metal-dependent hydrolase (beta-lactamase superfamily II)|uniref:N-acyl homoserine lactonase family protein n=1 Tax=Enterovirga sp. TaxID=2026350 RepID=UPI00261E7F21|nr:N-acyl homoserine lactonase family protein [Enterovirga sp.]MDB5592231.1 aiiA [Enterovirga sp.]